MSEDTYNARQRERDAQYKRDYAAWLASLPAEERRKLKEQGLDAPSLPGAASGLSDAATSTRARCEAAEFEDESEPEDDPQDALIEFTSSGLEAPQSADDQASNESQPSTETVHDLLRRLVGELISQDQSKLSLECLALVTGLTYDGASMTEIARKYGVTRAAVSKRCVELTQALNLNPSRAMRSRKARHSYRSARTLNLRHHA